MHFIKVPVVCHVSGNISWVGFAFRVAESLLVVVSSVMAFLSPLGPCVGRWVMLVGVRVREGVSAYSGTGGDRRHLAPR